MKNILIGLLLIPCLTAHSQVVTGGGADYPAKNSLLLLNLKIRALEKHLIAKDAECSQGGTRLLKSGDLVQTYLKLSLFKKTKATPDECDEVNRYFACLNDEKTKDLVSYVQEPLYTTILMSSHKISEEEAKRIVSFYRELGDKVK